MLESRSRRQRISDEPGFLLHTVPWRETSLVAEVLSRHHGRVGLVAKGARRARSELRAVLLSFQPLRLAWSGRSELKNLTAAQWVGGFAAPQAEGLLCAFYLNELLMRLLPREDPHPQLYDAYQQALIELGGLYAGGALSAPDLRAEREECLRRFEWVFLREIGYAPSLLRDNEGQSVRCDGWYQWIPEGGFQAADAGPGAAEGAPQVAGGMLQTANAVSLVAGTTLQTANVVPLVAGTTLQGLANGTLDSDAARLQAKRLTRSILAHYLGGRALRTRQILRALQEHRHRGVPDASAPQAGMCRGQIADADDAQGNGYEDEGFDG